MCSTENQLRSIILSLEALCHNDKPGKVLVVVFIYCFVIFFFLDLTRPLQVYFDLGFLRVQACVSLYLHMFLLHFSLSLYLVWLFSLYSDSLVWIYRILFCYYFLDACWFSKKRQKACRSAWERRWRRTGKGGGENVINILYEKIYVNKGTINKWSD